MRKLGFDSNGEPPNKRVRPTEEEDFGLDEGLKTIVGKDSKSSQEDDDYDDDYDYDEDSYIEKGYKEPTRRKAPSNKDRNSYNKKSKSPVRTIMTVLLVVALLAVCFFIYTKVQNTKNNTNEEDIASVTPDTGNGIPSINQSGENTSDRKATSSGTLVREDENGNKIEVIDDSKNNQSTNVNPGLPNMNVNTNMTSDTPVTDYKDFVSSIDGKQQDVNYEVSRIETAIDFVNYTKRRGVTGTGVELYWLEADYKNRPYVFKFHLKYLRNLMKQELL